MPDQQPLSRAIELAERILDEIVSPKQDWPAIEDMATALADLARRKAQPPSRPEDPTT